MIVDTVYATYNVSIIVKYISFQSCMYSNVIISTGCLNLRMATYIQI